MNSARTRESIWKGLRTGFININSLRAHINNLLHYLDTNPSYHLFGIAETRLGCTVPDWIYSDEIFLYATTKAPE